jgi:hypothetical protein
LYFFRFLKKFSSLQDFKRTIPSHIISSRLERSIYLRVPYPLCVKSFDEKTFPTRGGRRELPLRSNNPLLLVAGVSQRNNVSNASGWKDDLSEADRAAGRQVRCSVHTLPSGGETVRGDVFTASFESCYIHSTMRLTCNGRTSLLK